MAPLSVLTRIDQVGRAVVVRRTCSQLSPYWSGDLHLGQVPLDEAIGQERAGLGIVELLDVLLARPGPPCGATAQISPHSARFSGLWVLP